VIKVMYFDVPITASNVVAGTDVRMVLCLNAALIVLLGLMPGSLMALCAQSVLQMLGT
jgi:NADH-quinone oxidoreductase subunit N